MKRPKRFSATTLPPEGTVFAVPVTGGSFGACKVLATTRPGTPPLSPLHPREPAAFVAVITFAAPSPPTASSLPCGDLLCDPRGQVRGVWLAEVPPTDVRPVGVVPVTAAERDSITVNFSSWPWITGMIQREVAASPGTPDAGRKSRPSPTGEGPSSSQETVNAAGQRVPATTLPFGDWPEFHPANVVRAARRAAAEALTGMARLGATATADAKVKVLVKCVEAFNSLDGQHYFIDTIEREDITEFLLALAERHGVQDALRVIDKSRDW